MSSRSLADYISTFIAKGAVAFHRPGVPALIRYGATVEEGAQGPAFRTAFGRLETHPTHLDDPLGTGQPLGTVYLITKKPEAAFPDQIGVGRAANADVCVALPKISKYHAFFCAEPNGGFSVADAGPGIPADVATRLFTPFYTTRRDGMGLGLSLCRTVIEQHGGALDFGPTAGGGTTFQFTLPAAHGRATAAGPASAATTAT